MFRGAGAEGDGGGTGGHAQHLLRTRVDHVDLKLVRLEEKLTKINIFVEDQPGDAVRADEIADSAHQLVRAGRAPLHSATPLALPRLPLSAPCLPSLSADAMGVVPLCWVFTSIFLCRASSAPQQRTQSRSSLRCVPASLRAAFAESSRPLCCRL